MSIQTGKIVAKQLLNSQVGREITGSISNMIHRGIDKTSGTLQSGIENVSQNIKDRTSADNMTNSINKMGGKRTRKHSGGLNIIENEDGSRMNIIEDDEPHVNVIEDDHMNDMNVIENEVTGGKTKKNNRKTKKSKKLMKKKKTKKSKKTK